LGNFKQLNSNLGNNVQALHLNLHTIRNKCTNSNSLNHIWVIETASFKFGYNWKLLGKLEEFHSDLHILQTFGQITRAQIKFWPTETT